MKRSLLVYLLEAEGNTHLFTEMHVSRVTLRRETLYQEISSQF